LAAAIVAFTAAYAGALGKLYCAIARPLAERKELVHQPAEPAWPRKATAILVLANRWGSVVIGAGLERIG
jgi:hypothetical protein